MEASSRTFVFILVGLVSHIEFSVTAPINTTSATEATTTTTTTTTTTKTTTTIIVKATSTEYYTGSVNLTLSNNNDYLECSYLTGERDAYIITWMHNNTNIGTSGYSRNDLETHRLYLKGLPEEVGSYSCVLSDKSEKLFSNFIEVQAFLTVKSTNKTSSGAANSMTISCSVSAFPKLENFTFQHNTDVVVESDRHQLSSSTVGGTTTYELKINPLSFTDNGEYACHAATAHDTESITATTLFTNAKCSGREDWRCPGETTCLNKILCKTKDECLKYNCEKPNAVKNAKILHCLYDAAELHWEDDDNKVTYSVQVSTLNKFSVYYKTLHKTAAIPDLDNNTVYNFTIVAENNYGKSDGVELSCKTKRMTRPLQVLDARLVKMENNFQLNWDASVDDGMDNEPGVLQYEVKYCLTNTMDCFETKTTSTSLDVDDVKHNSWYTIDITPVNTAGQKGASKRVIIRAPPDLSAASVIQISNLFIFTVLLVAICGIN